MAVYILHFSGKLYHARHYVGFTDDFKRREKEHMNGHACGSPLVAAAKAAGLTVTVAKGYQDGGRELERKIKRGKNTSKYCPLCRAEKQKEKKKNVSRNHVSPAANPATGQCKEGLEAKRKAAAAERGTVSHERS